ncbi:hypothetical protein H0H93_010104 [Arthromyces matolae]|nr:hypothetical protein H0H93_010104 [Arthromyces matolae]
MVYLGRQIVSILVESDNELGLLARNPTDKANNTEAKKEETKPELKPVTIPPGFLPNDSRSSTHELKLSLPGRQDLMLWGSVLNIVNLMDEAAKKNPNELDVPRNNFEKELVNIGYFKSLEALADRVRKDRPGITWLRQTPWSDLEELRRGIKEAVLRHNEFEGEIRMPMGFFPEDKPLWIKVPYPGNKQAVTSLYLILECMRLATSKDDWHLADRLSTLRYHLTSRRFRLPLPKPEVPVNRRVLKSAVIQEDIQRLVEQHNDNKWVTETDIDIADIQEGENIDHSFMNHDLLLKKAIYLDGDDIDCSPERTQIRRSMKLRKKYFLPKARKNDKYMNIPSSDNKEGVKSMNRILDLMTYVACEDQEKWKERRNILAGFGLEVMPEPHIWPAPPRTEEEGENRRQMVLDAVTEHNKRQGEWRKEQTRQRKDACRVKRPADGPHTRTQAPNLRVGGQQQDTGKEKSHLSTDIVGQGRGMIEGQQDKGQTPPHIGQEVGTHGHQGLQRSTSGRTFDPVREIFV